MSHMQNLRHYLSMIKFSHSIFALPLAGITCVQALVYRNIEGIALYVLMGQVALCMIFLRSSAMGFNRLVDRHFDAVNPRTARREIPAGILSVRQARLFVCASALLFLLTAASINTVTAILALPVLLLVYAYSYTKRFSCLAHFFLGFAIGLAPLGAWLAVLARFDLLPLFWSAGLLFYIAGFDILYACQDIEFDRQHKLHSLPARLGLRPALWIARLAHVLALVFFVGAAWEAQAGLWLSGALVVVGALFIMEHWLVRPQTLENIPIAFFHVNAAISSILFIGVLLDQQQQQYLGI